MHPTLTWSLLPPRHSGSWVPGIDGASGKPWQWSGAQALAWLLLARSLQSGRGQAQWTSDAVSDPLSIPRRSPVLQSSYPCRWELGGGGWSVPQQTALVPHNGGSWPQLQPIVTMWGCGPSNCQKFRYFQSSCKSRLLHHIFQFLSADNPFKVLKTHWEPHVTQGLLEWMFPFCRLTF